MLEKSSKKMTNPQFLSKAPENIVQKEKDKVDQFNRKLNYFPEQLERMKNIKR
ncbi:MAG: hypothetical protein U5N58_05370 [Actinomycetota bacterium]|nr:hypothetical protein [Actinomycetota bacterium]